LNPIAWYKFDISSNIGLDTIGNYNLTNLTQTSLVGYNSISFVKGSGSASFNGTKEILYNSSFYNIKNNSFTINFWMYDNIVQENRVGWIFSFGEAGQGHRSVINKDYLNHIVFYMDSTDTDRNNLSYYIPDNIVNTWTMISITYNINTNLAEMYFNGLIVDSKTFENIITFLNYSFCLGSIYQYRNFAEWSFKGLLDDFRIYNVVLTPTEILNLYNGSIYKFGDGGIGVDYSSYFGTSVGDNGWFGGGGGGGGNVLIADKPGKGGKGGGADGIVSDSFVTGNDGMPNTGGGGGGCMTADIYGSKGGSGVVIVRILKDETPIFKLGWI